MTPNRATRLGLTHAAGLLGICATVLLGIFAAVWVMQTSAPASNDEEGLPGSAELTDTARDRFPVSIRKPVGPPRVFTGVVDAEGNAVTVSCSTCHATRPPNLGSRTSADLNEFHMGMQFSHGSISCLACHNPNDYDALKLADGTREEFSEVMTLCAQCHGPQMTDYEHGTHGGMAGFWDSRRGPQTKLNCVDCHLPHAPQFPKMRPTFKPRDRFLSPEGTDH